jgi:hypothetical protein
MTESLLEHIALTPQRVNPRARSTIKRSFVLYAVLLLLCGWGFAGWYIYQDRTRTIEAADEQLRAVADSLLVQMEAMLVDGLGSSQSVLTDLGKFGPLSEVSDDFIHTELQEEVTGGYVRALFIGDEARTIVAADHIAERNSGIPTWLPRMPAEGETIVGLPTPDPSHEGRQVIPLARGVADVAQRPVWVGMWFDVEELVARYQPIGAHD